MNMTAVNLISSLLSYDDHQVLILSGLPGAGKTYLCKLLPAHAMKVSADDYFMCSGKYDFNPTLLPKAHNHCLSLFVASIKDSEKLIVVDNTNLSAWEIAPYYRLAEVNGYRPTIIRCYCDPYKAFLRQVHGVPAHQFFNMAGRFLANDLPPFWRVEGLVTG